MNSKSINKYILTAVLILSLCLTATGCRKTDNEVNIPEQTASDENLSEDSKVDDDTTQYGSVDMVYDNTLFTEKNSTELCKLSDVNDLSYYIFCDTALAYGPSDIIHTYGIYGGVVDEWEEGEQLYQEFKTDFFNESGDVADPETEGKGQSYCNLIEIFMN